MSSYNRAILMGNLTRDPETRYTKKGTACCGFGLAVNRKYGEKEEVLFIDCTIFGKSAETFSEFMKKGSPVLVEGHLRLETWEDKDDNKKSKISLTVDNFWFLGTKEDDDSGERKPKRREDKEEEGEDDDRRPSKGEKSSSKSKSDDDQGGFNEDDDVPF